MREMNNRVFARKPEMKRQKWQSIKSKMALK